MRRFLSVLLGILLFSFSANAVPSHVIILRHGEKATGSLGAFALCGVGVARSVALAQTYLGKGAGRTLLPPQGPAAVLAITLHTIELASPSAQSWSLPLTAYSAVPIKDSPYGDSDSVLDARTQQAAQDVLTNPAWNGKTIVMVWEHKHIANAGLENKTPPVTLRQLLHLDVFGNKAPATWDGANYDYFWVVTYGNAGSTTPTDFKAVKQVYSNPAIPQNEWGKPNNLLPNSGCKISQH